MHGYELKQHLSLLTGHFRLVSDGALYPAVARLERLGYIVKRPEPGKAGVARQVLILTNCGEAELSKRLKASSDVDISDRNRFFTILAFIQYLDPQVQREILLRRLSFLDTGQSFFCSNGRLVTSAQELNPFRRDMLLFAKEISKIERQWLQELIKQIDMGIE